MAWSFHVLHLMWGSEGQEYGRAVALLRVVNGRPFSIAAILVCTASFGSPPPTPALQMINHQKENSEPSQGKRQCSQVEDGGFSQFNRGRD
jgi:hypothetical protein